MKFSIANVFTSVTESFSGIMRNRRRSMAMISGIILGTLIISSILIYTGILQEDNYRSIIQSTSYEASFTLSDPGPENRLWNVVDSLEDEKRVESMTVFGGIPFSSTFGDGEHMGRSSLSISISGDVKLLDVDDFGRGAEITPLFVRDNFTSTSIYDKMIGSNIEGTFELGAGLNRTVIPRSTANRLNLEVGDVVSQMNITMVELRRNEVTTTEFNLMDIHVSGIYDTEQEGLGGFLSNFLRVETIYFNTEVLYKYDSELVPLFEKKGYFYMAVKIDQDEFTLEDTETLNLEINRLINDITDESGELVTGSNNVGNLLTPFTILNYFLIVFDFLLVLPTVVLSIYLLIFGLDLSLEERRREIAILKVQGADSKQIFRILRNESLVLFLVGVTLGYILAMMGAWVISSSVGFMNFNLDTAYLANFLQFDFWAFLFGFLIIGSVVLLAIRKKGKTFIELEVTQAVQRMEWKKAGFLRRNNVDIIMLIFGGLCALITILELVFGITTVFGVELSLGTAFDVFVIGFLGTIFFWLGGMLSGPRIAKWMSIKLEGIFLRLSYLKDVGNIVKSGLKRRGDVARLVVIIVLTLSVATLAVAQGFTDEQYSIRTLEYEIGSDYQLEFSIEENHTVLINDIKGVNQVMALPSLTAKILSTATTVYGMDPAIASFAVWHENSFEDITYEEALSTLDMNVATPKVFLGTELALHVDAKVGDIIKLKAVIEDDEEELVITVPMEVEVVALFDHAPGHIGSNSVICTYETFNRLKGLMGNYTPVLSDELEATNYLIDLGRDADRKEVEKGFDQLEGILKVRDLEDEKNNIGNQMNFGIPGLLTMMFITALAASITSAFAFSSIIMKRRKREFAVLQTLGASRGQVYKTAIGENALLMLISVMLGILLGIGVSYQMNGFFEFIGEILGRGELDRLVFIPWGTVLIIGLVTLAGMLTAVALSARSAARQDLAVATRVI
ncbi:MAG: FtsX-like permease family protein [Candidatus Thermoplasmatota archaeon]|nr:FtsX-like permease family protein [Candidatus Thermoplasmatota archaeon]